MIGQFLSNIDLMICQHYCKAIFSELKIADFPGLCVASLNIKYNLFSIYIVCQTSTPNAIKKLKGKF